MARVWSLAVVVAVAAVATTVALAAQSPKQLRAAMLHAASSRHSLHYASSSSIPGAAIHFVSDVARGRGIQRITVTKHGRSGPATVLIVGRTAYIRGNAFTLHDYFPFTPAAARRYARKWISIPSTNGLYAGVAADATFASFVADLLPSKRLTLVHGTTAGRKSVGLRGVAGPAVETVYAPASGVPLPFAEKVTGLDRPGGGSVRMSRWNEPVHVTAPANAVPLATVLG